MLKKFKSLHWFLKFLIFFSLIVLVLTILSALNRILPTKIISNQEVRGFILQNQIWEGEIRITGDTIALPSTTVTISSGTKIFISRENDKNNFDFLPWHLKSGVNTGLTEHGVVNGAPFWNEKEKVQVRLWRVRAIGNQSSPIVITSDNPMANIYDVNLIRIETGEINFVNLSNFRRLEIGQDVLLKNSHFMYTGECAVCINRGSPLIEGNIFEKGGRSFIEVGFASPVIKDNQFLDSSGNGVSYYGINQSEVKLMNNIFHIPNRKAVTILTGNIGGVIQGNIFDIGDIEIPCTSKVRLENNHIKSKIFFRNPESCLGDYLVGINYWETTDLDSIRATKFIGISDNFRVIVPEILYSF